MGSAALLIALGYLVGSVPFGYLLVRLTKGQDVRGCGSHNIGAINVVHIAGAGLGVLTLLLDAGKAFAVVALTGALGAEDLVVAATAASAMVGHSYSVWFLLLEGKLSGGKSVASALGVLIALGALGELAWWAALLPPALWIVLIVGPRLVIGHWWYMSVATMTAAVSIPASVWAARAQLPYVVLSLAIAVLLLIRHRDNIARLRSGTEPTLAQRLLVHPSNANMGQQAAAGGGDREC